MYSFKSDYSEGTHPNILKALNEINFQQWEGYGEDELSLRAGQLIKKALGREDVDIHMLAGGTQTNLTAISAFLRPHQAVIAARTGHIYVHEAGSIEATGHKILIVEGKDGKVSPADIEPVLIEHCDEHMVQPKLVYISNASEIGTLYTKKELFSLSAYCRKHGLYLFMDGARLGPALAATCNDLCLADVADCADAFYIGGTKNGALFGEALVIKNDLLKEDFRFHMKQNGALPAKGASISVQFGALFENDLYDELAKQANGMALKLATGIKELGVSFLGDTETNQIFPILSNSAAEKLHELYGFLDWQPMGDDVAVRLVTSWATPEDKVKEFISDLSASI
ncbi:MAG: aminotransferase class I/II-fold pyridoxal phosphate-dependent enzyme [Clostridiales bacterium]|nr:aminotransferase class I/II-fold pyridoxal phosphate-dependent enzyme [Clostridiales bacterium]